MTTNLAGCKVLVTRPQEQAVNLCQLINSAGGIAIPLPTLEISVARDMTRAQFVELLSWSSHVIFVSRNAVVFADQFAGDLAAPLQGKSVLAVGGATAKELIGRKIYHVSMPEKPSGSETLLGLEEFKTDNVRGKNVLIVRGNDGRELLKEELLKRGANVRNAEVYRRSKPDIVAGVTQRIWHDTRPDVIVVTSEQGLQNLVELTNEDDRKILYAGKLVVISSRVRDTARALGFVYPPTVATEQSDQGLLQAIDKARS